MVIHFFALTYLTVEVTDILPLDKYRENYPYDNIWIAREEDRDYAQKLTEKYDGTLEEIPMLRVSTRWGAQQIGVSASDYEKMSGKTCDLKGREIWIGIEDDGFRKERQMNLTSWDDKDAYEFLYVGNFDPQFNLIMMADREEGKAYQYDIQKAFTQNVIGQYSVDQYHENIIVFSDEFFEERREEALSDQTEATALYLFNGKNL